MWGEPLFLYHYASYAVPAAVDALTRSGAYEVFASFLLPVGVLLTGLAAFAFGGGVFGRWPAVAASAALLLVPDAYQQGFGNKYLSVGASYNPAVLSGLTWSQIATDLHSPSTPVAKSVLGAANYLTAAICGLTNDQPAAACTATVKSLRAKI